MIKCPISGAASAGGRGAGFLKCQMATKLLSRAGVPPGGEAGGVRGWLGHRDDPHLGHQHRGGGCGGARGLIGIMWHPAYRHLNLRFSQDL